MRDMAINNLKQKLAQIVEKRASTWKQDAEWRRENRSWLKKSAHIAMQVLNQLDELGWSQKDLAEQMGTSPQYISKLCKGHENLTLKNITMLESILGICIDAQSIDDFVDFKAHDHITVQFDDSFVAAISSLMSKINVAIDHDANHVRISAKTARTLPIPLKTNNQNSVKTEVERFAMSA
jgi:ribosome-binding protein aMBF1 (putative translation factor)